MREMHASLGFSCTLHPANHSARRRSPKMVWSATSRPPRCTSVLLNRRGHVRLWYLSLSLRQRLFSCSCILVPSLFLGKNAIKVLVAPSLHSSERTQWNLNGASQLELRKDRVDEQTHLPRRQAVQSLHPRASPLHRLASPATLTFSSILFFFNMFPMSRMCSFPANSVLYAHDPLPSSPSLRSNFLCLVLLPIPFHTVPSSIITWTAVLEAFFCPSSRRS